MAHPTPRFSFNKPLLVVDVVGLRPKDLDLAPQIRAVADGGGRVEPLTTIVPAVTCSVQASILTGVRPQQHGVVGNGWYFRDLCQVWLWRQSNKLVQAKEIYDYGLESDDDFKCAKLFWWFNMYSSAAVSLTPRPQYFADGLKMPGVYSRPAELADEIQADLGPFPLFRFWGPAADVTSTTWIVDASIRTLERERPDLALVYLPHLDYDHQRWGPDDARSRAAVTAVDVEAGRLIDRARALGMEVLVVSEYGIETVERPVFLNRDLRRAGLLATQRTAHGELLDFGASRAFAVCDHQVGHVYVDRDADLSRVRAVVAAIDGVDRVLDRGEQSELGLDHDRSGELVALAERDSWFAYHYWFDEDLRPDFAPTVDIHRKPGYDPAELFLDPGLRFPKLALGWRLLQKKLGFRYLMDVISTDPSMVRGSHGLLPSAPDLGPVCIASPGLTLPDHPRVESLLFK